MTDSRDNGYFVNQELIEEMVRLNRQANIVTDALGGALPEQDERILSGVQDVLDLACGPGEWVMRVATEHPNWRVTGVDKSKRMIAYASVQAEAEGTDAHFQEMDITQPLGFSDASFDLVNIRFILTFMKREQWPLLLAECYRVLRPGGTLRITEQESGFASDAIYQRYIDLWGDVWIKAGHSFAHSHAYIGVTVMLKLLMRELGFVEARHRPIAIDLSTGEPIHRPMMENLIEALRLGGPFLLRWGVATQQFLDDLYEDMRTLIDRPGFCAFWLLQTCWSQKPRTEAP
jgi:SAM-dependent methyltransferase